MIKMDPFGTIKTLLTLNMAYEIAIFEYSDIYDGNDIVEEDKVVETFIKHYTHYFNPDYVEEDDVGFQKGRTWLSYLDMSGGDKPITIMLIGPITPELIIQLEEAVKKVYMKTCCDCNKKFEGKKWALCEACRNKD